MVTSEFDRTNDNANIEPTLPDNFDMGNPDKHASYVAVDKVNRLYLAPDGTIPGTDDTPAEIGIQVFTGERGGSFVDKRVLQSLHPSHYNDAHSPHDTVLIGGIITDADGNIIMLQPTDGDILTLPKGPKEKGETDAQAAARIVLETAGLECTITGQVPGHYTANGESTKFYTMEIIKDNNQKGDDVLDVKPMPYTEIRKNLEAEDNPEAESTVQALAAAEHESKEVTKSTPRSQFDAQTQDYIKAHTDMDKILEEVYESVWNDGILPENFAENNPVFVENLRKRLLIWHGNHADTDKAKYSGDKISRDLSRTAHNLAVSIDKSLGLDTMSTKSMSHVVRIMLEKWGESALGGTFPDKYATDVSGHFLFNYLAHITAEKLGQPITRLHNVDFPASVDNAGNPVFRSQADRQAYVQAYEAWKDGNSDGTGTLPSGEAFNFNLEKTMDLSVFSPTAKAIKSVTKNSHDIRYKRDKEIERIWEKYGLNNMMEVTAERLNEIAASIDPESPTGKVFKNMDGDQLFNRWKNAQGALTQGLIQKALPGVTSLKFTRQVGNLREIVGDLHASKTFQNVASTTGFADLSREQQLAHLEELGIVPDKANPITMFSAPLFGAAKDPQGYGYGKHGRLGRCELIAPIDKVLFHSDLSNTGFESETEAILMNSNDISAVYITNPNYGGTFGKNKVEISDAGVHTAGAFDGRHAGIFNYNINFKEELVPATATDVEKGKVDKHGQHGSNLGSVVKDSAGKFYYLKPDNLHRAANEGAANAIYKETGILVPTLNVVNYGDDHATMSEWVSEAEPLNADSPEITQGHPDIKHGFYIDAILGNLDVAGQTYDNLIKTPDGKIMRIDQGGALSYRAQGAPKPDFHIDDAFTPLKELQGFLDSSINPQTSAMFANMTEADWSTAAEKMLRLTNSKLKSLLENSALPASEKEKMYQTLIRRRDSAFMHAQKQEHIGKLNEDGEPDDSLMFRLYKMEDLEDLFKSDTEFEKPPQFYIDDDLVGYREAADKESLDLREQRWEDLIKFHESELD